LAVAGLRGAAGAGLEVRQDARERAAAGLPDDAERAPVVAAVLHLQDVAGTAGAGRLDLPVLLDAERGPLPGVGHDQVGAQRVSRVSVDVAPHQDERRVRVLAARARDRLAGVAV